jgi:hypothetical protein
MPTLQQEEEGIPLFRLSAPIHESIQKEEEKRSSKVNAALSPDNASDQNNPK